MARVVTATCAVRLSFSALSCEFAVRSCSMRSSLSPWLCGLLCLSLDVLSPALKMQRIFERTQSGG